MKHILSIVSVQTKNAKAYGMFYNKKIKLVCATMQYTKCFHNILER